MDAMALRNKPGAAAALDRAKAALATMPGTIDDEILDESRRFGDARGHR